MQGKLISILIYGFLSLILTGCGLSELLGFGTSSQAAAQSIESLADAARFTVVMDDNFFGYSDSNMVSPPVWTLPKGRQAIFTFENNGILEHNWVIVQPGATIPVPFDENQARDLLLYDLGKVPGEGVTQVAFTAPIPGTYQVICTVSGHYPFMQGRLVVTEEGR